MITENQKLLRFRFAAGESQTIQLSQLDNNKI